MTAPDRVLPMATEETTASVHVATVDAATNGFAIDVCHREGDVIPAADLAVRYPRPDASAVVRPFSSGATADADPATFAEGECRTVTPPVEGGRVRVALRHTPSNLTLVDEWVSVGGAAGG